MIRRSMADTNGAMRKPRASGDDPEYNSMVQAFNK